MQFCRRYPPTTSPTFTLKSPLSAAFNKCLYFIQSPPKTAAEGTCSLRTTFAAQRRRTEGKALPMIRHTTHFTWYMRLEI